LGRFGLQPNGYLMMCSRLVRHKGAHLLISAYRRLKAEGQTRGLKLAIVGGSAFTDDYVEELKALAGDDRDIVFTDTQSGKALEQLFANCYMVVHPSSSEGLPIAVLEAMSYGKAVLGSDIPEIVEVTRDNGFSFRNRDLEHLSYKLAGLIERPELVWATGKRARAMVLTDYAWDDVAADVARLYREVAGRAKRPLASKAGNELRQEIR
jgi:glycosyltransferase involved in cell wall biosynthesis